MNIEIITVGDELLTGHTVDTNSAFMAQKLTDRGLTVKYKTSVGDSIEDMEEAFRLALGRAQVVLVTGGLGPTDDDITKRAIVKVFKRNLVFHEEILEDLKKRFAKRGMELPPINQNQALLPQGATFFPNRNGSAVGICFAEQGKVFIALPGVPFEMQQILEDDVIPYLTGIDRNANARVVKLRTTGVPESKLAELIKPDLKLEPGMRLAYLPSFGGTDLRLIATGDDAVELDARVEKLVQHLENAAGKYIYGRDKDTLESVVGQLLKDNDKTLSVAESCTAGQLGMTITNVPGSSAWFIGGVQAYANDVKMDLLKVDAEILQEFGAVSEECAMAMAAGCRKLVNSDYALSITGIAGPDGGTDEKPVGTTFIGLASPHANLARQFHLGRDRTANRSRACYAALEMLRREILDIK